MNLRNIILSKCSSIDVQTRLQSISRLQVIAVTISLIRNCRQKIIQQCIILEHLKSDTFNTAKECGINTKIRLAEYFATKANMQMKPFELK